MASKRRFTQQWTAVRPWRGKLHSYQHNIKTFNNATRHLTRVERSLYRDAIEMYYDTEQPLPAVDFDRLARRLLATTEEEKAALQCVLDEFFVLTGDVYTHDFCDSVIEEYRGNISAKARAGKASAEARKKKAEALKASRSAAKSIAETDSEQALNSCSTSVDNHKPETINHKPTINPPSEDTPPAGTGPVPFKQIVDLYHELLPELPKCMVLSESRKGQIRQRHVNDIKTLENWESFFLAIKRSDFLMGRKPGSGDKPPFIADLEWITKMSNFIKIAEGKYHRD